MKDLSKIKKELLGYEGRSWNSYAGNYSYEDILFFFQTEIEDNKDWYVDYPGNIWFPPMEGESPTTENQAPFFNILGKKFRVEIVETYRRYIEVEAENEDGAYNKVDYQVMEGVIDLPCDGEDYKYERELFVSEIKEEEERKAIANLDMRNEV